MDFRAEITLCSYAKLFLIRCKSSLQPCKFNAHFIASLKYRCQIFLDYFILKYSLTFRFPNAILSSQNSAVKYF